jgi:hypothetical protein
MSYLIKQIFNNLCYLEESTSLEENKRGAFKIIGSIIITIVMSKSCWFERQELENSLGGKKIQFCLELLVLGKMLSSRDGKKAQALASD